MNSGKTAISRKRVSAPMAYLAKRRGAPYNMVVLHFGEGKAYEDTKYLRRNGSYVIPYDPNSDDPDTSNPIWLNMHWNLGVAIYVLNTLEHHERREALRQLQESCDTIILAMRTDKIKGTPYQDGVITKRGTFQTQLNAGAWMEWCKRMSPEWASVEVLHKASGYVILDVRR